MKRKNTTRKALFTSVLSLLLCVSMLVGTTFAWFTDSVESGINQIAAGNLDVELYHTNTKDTNEKVSDATKLFDEVDPKLWEPGAMAYENLTVKNEGSLALKYQLAINFANATEVNGHTLVEALKVGVVEGGFKGTTREAVLAEVTNWQTLASFVLPGNLQAGKSEVYGIVIYWEPSANDNLFNMNNDNQGKVLSIDLGVKLEATQLTSEYDSFGNDYDAMAGGYYNVVYGFNNPADLLAFAPVAGDADSSGLSITDDGEAQIDKPGAWYTVDADLSKHEYVIEYDIDISNLSVGENVTVDTGNAANWASTPIMLERGSTKVYYGISKNEELGTLEGTVVHVTHTYQYNADNKLEVTTTVSDGEASVTYTKALAASAQTELYWDIYYATDAGKATMDNFSVKSADAVVDSSAELAAALAEGGKVVLTNDIAATEGFILFKDLELDLNGHTVTITGEKKVLFTVGDGANEGKDCKANLTINGGKLVVESTNGVLDGTGASTGASCAVDFMSTGTLTINDTEIIGSRRGGYRAVEVAAGKGYLNNVTIDCAYGSGVNAYWGSYVEMNNCDITVAGMYSAPYNSVCFSVMYGSEMVINSGNYKMINDNTYSTGASHGGWVGIVMNSGGTLTINGGNYTNVPAAGFNPQYERAIFELENNAPAVATLNLLGGTFDPQYNKIYAGYGDKYYPTYNVPNLADNCDGTWTALPVAVEGETLVKHAESGLYWNGNAANYKSVFYLFNAEDLVKAAAYFQHQTRTSEANRVTFELMNDIDMADTAWTPWGVMWIQFNGNGHKISNLTTQEDWRAGFFGYIGASIINDLTLENVTSYGAQAGTFAGSVEGVTFTNCVLQGNNAVTYKEYVSPSYTETWGGIGAVTGVVANSTINVEIANGAVVTMNNNGMVTNCAYVDVLTGYLQANNGVVVNNGEIVFAVNNTADLISAIKNAPVGKVTQIVLADGTYAGDIKITVADLGKSGGDVVIKAAEGAKPVISGTMTLGYRNQGVGSAMWNANMTFEGITFDHAEAQSHSLDVQDVKSLTLNNCTIIGDGEYGLTSARGNATGESRIVSCTFENAGMQLLGNFATGLVIEKCTFNDSCINIQAGNGVTVQNCEFNATLTDANINESFYLIRTNSTPVTVKDCKINIDSTITDVATAQAKWGALWNRGTTNWTVKDVAVTLTEAAQAQTELLLTKCTSTGVINTENLTVNGVKK